MTVWSRWWRPTKGQGVITIIRFSSSGNPEHPRQMSRQSGQKTFSFGSRDDWLMMVQDTCACLGKSIHFTTVPVCQPIVTKMDSCLCTEWSLMLSALSLSKSTLLNLQCLSLPLSAITLQRWHQFSSLQRFTSAKGGGFASKRRGVCGFPHTWGQFAVSLESSEHTFTPWGVYLQRVYSKVSLGCKLLLGSILPVWVVLRSLWCRWYYFTDLVF